jgi:hypothetical protein
MGGLPRFEINSRYAADQSNDPMNAAYLPVFAALAGSVIGALASLGTTWLNQYAQERARQHSQLREQRAELYGEFIEEASRLYADSMTHDLGNDLSKFVLIYALIGKLRLVSSAEVVTRANEVMQRIVESYQSPPISNFQNITAEWRQSDLDVLRGFSEACREDLSS